MTSRYTYGDTDLAAERLELLGRLFEPSSRSFLSATVADPPSIAVDLGSGPGKTTALIKDATGAERVIGIDRSWRFVRLGRVSTGLPFIVGDVLSNELPVRSASMVYARLVIAHTRDPSAVVQGWTRVLEPHGRVLVDDLESIEADEVFHTYLEDVALAVVRAAGGKLFVGPQLHAAPDPEGLARVHDQVVEITPPVADTARMFGMNLRVLTETDQIPARPVLAEALHTIATGEVESAPVRWKFRQMAWERSTS